MPARKLTIAGHYEAARKLAMRKLIAAARKILREHPHLDEFVCAMGSAFFTNPRDEADNLHPHERKYMQPVARILGEWDEYLRLTGEGIRFTARGKIVRGW